jgi:hypothetical protein
MNARFSLLALLALASCNAADRRSDEAANRQTGNLVGAATPVLNRAGSPEPRQEATSRLDDLDANAAAPTQPAPDAVNRSWFAGRWTDSQDCADAATFAANGTYILADGTRGMWNVQDSRLVIQNAGGRAVVRVRKIEDGVVETISDDGSVGRSTRC